MKECCRSKVSEVLLDIEENCKMSKKIQDVIIDWDFFIALREAFNDEINKD